LERFLINRRHAGGDQESTVSNLHSLLDRLLAAGSLYSWRLDGLVLGGMLWVLATGYAQLRTA
jgi:hypothetical protein